MITKTQNHDGHLKNGSVLKYLGGDSWIFEYFIGFTMWMMLSLQTHGEKPLNIRYKDKTVI